MARQDELRQARNSLLAAERQKINAKRDIKVWRKKIAELEAKPTLPVPNSDQIIFHKKFDPYGTRYRYGAIKAGNGLWYLTGEQSPQGLTWDEVVEFIAKDNLFDLSYFEATHLNQRIA